MKVPPCPWSHFESLQMVPRPLLFRPPNHPPETCPHYLTCPLWTIAENTGCEKNFSVDQILFDASTQLHSTHPFLALPPPTPLCTSTSIWRGFKVEGRLISPNELTSKRERQSRACSHSDFVLRCQNEKSVKLGLRRLT